MKQKDITETKEQLKQVNEVLTGQGFTRIIGTHQEEWSKVYEIWLAKHMSLVCTILHLPEQNPYRSIYLNVRVLNLVIVSKNLCKNVPLRNMDDLTYLLGTHTMKQHIKIGNRYSVFVIR